MIYDWDEQKRIVNWLKHDVDFKEVYGFRWDTAQVITDDRCDYGEIRRIAYGFIGARLHTLVFTVRNKQVRVIGLRKSNGREVKVYENKTRAH